MDVILAVVTTILGALIGGPIGFLFERIYSRPRVALDYAQTMYQDVYKFPSKTQGLVKQNTEFVHFMGSLTPWRFDQRLNGNVFTKGELAIIVNL